MLDGFPAAKVVFFEFTIHRTSRVRHFSFSFLLLAIFAFLAWEDDSKGLDWGCWGSGS